MMRAFAGLLICVGGCTFVHGELPEGEGDDGSGSGSSQPGGDVDADGLPDLTDNCAKVGNADQRDHDDDGRGDACDVCPHLIDSGGDADDDGVGDACDPHPTTAGDRIAFFEGFYGAVAWQPVIGQNNWEVVDGTLHQAELTEPYQLVRDDDPNLVNVFVDAKLRVNSISSNVTQRRSAGLVLGYGDPKHFFFCGLAANAVGSEVNAGEVSTDFFGTTQYEYAAYPFGAAMPGSWLTLQATVTQTDAGAHIDCLSHRADLPPGEASFEADQDAAGDIGLRTNGTDTSFDYIFVVDLAATTP
jgi:thrombospondin type 3 repeat protein